MALRPIASFLCFATLAGCTLIDLTELGGDSGAGQSGGESSAGNGPNGGSPDTGGSTGQGANGNGGAPPDPTYDACIVGDEPAVFFRLNSASDATSEANLGSLSGAGTFSGSHVPFLPGLVDDDDASTMFADQIEAGQLAFTSDGDTLSGAQPFSFEAWVRMPLTVATTSLIKCEQGGNLLELRVLDEAEPAPDKIQLRFVLPTAYGRTVGAELSREMIGQTVHIVAVYRQNDQTVFTGGNALSDDMVLYLNGKLASDDTTGIEIAMPSFVTDLHIGNGFEGLLDEVAVYPRELSAAEVAHHHALGLDASLGCD